MSGKWRPETVDIALVEPHELSLVSAAFSLAPAFVTDLVNTSFESFLNPIAALRLIYAYIPLPNKTRYIRP